MASGHEGSMSVVIHRAFAIKGAAVAIEGGGVLQQGDGPSGFLELRAYPPAGIRGAFALGSVQKTLGKIHDVAVSNRENHETRVCVALAPGRQSQSDIGDL